MDGFSVSTQITGVESLKCIKTSNQKEQKKHLRESVNLYSLNFKLGRIY